MTLESRFQKDHQKVFAPKMLLSSWKRISKKMRLLWCLRTTGRLDKKLHAMTKALGVKVISTVFIWGQGHGKITRTLPLSQSLIVIDKKFVLRTGPFLWPNGLFSNSSKILIQTMSLLGLKRINKEMWLLRYIQANGTWQEIACHNLNLGVKIKKRSPTHFPCPELRLC